jgi:hypothetical protein
MQNSGEQAKAFKIKAFVGIIVALLFSIVCLSEFLSVVEYSAEYQMVYHFAENSEYWKYQSIENYKLWNLTQAVVSSIYILLNVVYIRKRSTNVQYVLLMLESIAIISVIQHLYQWYSSGFDH